MSKVLEKVVYTQLCAHLDHLNYIYLHQYGFIRGHNTAQAIAQVNSWFLSQWIKEKSLVYSLLTFQKRLTR